MASGSFNLTRTSGSQYISFYAEWSSESFTMENHSRITVNVYATKSSSSTQNTRCTVVTGVGVDGANPSYQNNSGESFWLNIAPGATVLLATFSDYVVPHNNDGTKSTTINVTVDGNTVLQANGSATITLDTIVRATLCPDLIAYVKNPTTVTLTPYVDTYYHAISIRVGNVEGYVNANGNLQEDLYYFDNTVRTIPITLPSSVYAEFTGPSTTGTIVVRTYKYSKLPIVGDTYTYIGIHGKQFTVLCDPVLCSPTVSATAFDINEKSVILTDSDGKDIIKYGSDVLITPTIVASDTEDTATTIISKVVNGVAFDADAITIVGATSNVFTLTVTNSRNMSTTIPVNTGGELIEYLPLTFNIVKLHRPEPTTGEVEIEYNGDFFSGTFGETGTENELVLTWVYREKGSTEWLEGGTLTPSIDAEKNSYSGKNSLGTIFDYQKQYEFLFSYSDKILEGESGTIGVARGYPVIWWNENTLNVIGNVRADNYYGVGSVYFSDSETDPSELFGGTWELARTLYGGELIAFGCATATNGGYIEIDALIGFSNALVGSARSYNLTNYVGDILSDGADTISVNTKGIVGMLDVNISLSGQGGGGCAGVWFKGSNETLPTGVELLPSNGNNALVTGPSSNLYGGTSTNLIYKVDSEEDLTFNIDPIISPYGGALSASISGTKSFLTVKAYSKYGTTYMWKRIS